PHRGRNYLEVWDQGVEGSPPPGLTWVLTVPTSVLVTKPLVLTSSRKLAPVTSTEGLTCVFTFPTSVLVTTRLAVTSPRRTPSSGETMLPVLPSESSTPVKVTLIY